MAALDYLCNAAEAVRLEPLVLAIVDTKGRAEEELARATDALERPGEAGEDLHPREAQRLGAMLRRSADLIDAYHHLSDNPLPCPEDTARILETLRELKEEAGEHFRAYRSELGPDR